MGDKFTLRRFFGLLRLQGAMDFMWVMRDTRTVLIVVLTDLITSIADVSGIFLLSWRFDGVGGMTRWEVLLMLGYITCLQGVYMLFFGNGNVVHISRRIGRGQLDHMLMQPVPLPAQLLADGFTPFTGNINLLCGIAITAAALNGLGFTPTIRWILGFAGFIILSLAIIIGIAYIFSALAFWAPVACEEISSEVLDIAFSLNRYPLSSLQPRTQLALITIFPVGLLGWFPVCALLGKSPLGFSSLLPFVTAAIIWFIAYILFRKGMRHYAKTGSFRYKSAGHRR
jgi:ABC-2 type transport system permease protein